MILMLSGEGKTDMGQMVPTERGMRFEPGPMAWLVDRLIENRLNYSPLAAYKADGDSLSFISEKEVADGGKQSSGTFLPGVKFGKGGALYTRNAQVLGLLAGKLQQEKDDSVAAVLFRDTDTTKSASKTEWQKKIGSMKRGFELADFPHGVPMMPLPKSEAWLLCALKQDSYQQCDKLEEAAGSDNSPNSLKKRLEKVIGHDASAAEQAEWVRTGKIDPGRIDMPSFNAFRDELNGVLE